MSYSHFLYDLSPNQIITHSVHWLDCYGIGIVGTRYSVMIIFFRWRCTVCRYVWSTPILRWQYFVHIICTFFLTDNSLIWILGAMKNNTHLLKKGALVLLPELDDEGRSIIFANPSLRGDGDPDKVSIAMNAWYCFNSSWMTFVESPTTYRRFNFGGIWYTLQWKGRAVGR